jgi:hypothetical protein
MKRQKSIFVVLLVLLGLGLATLGMRGQEKSSPGTVPVHMVVMVEPLRDSDNTVPALSREDVKVRQGKNNLQVTGWIPARGDQAGLQLFILIDDTCDTTLGGQLDDLRAFIKAQPATTWIGVGYMRNAGVNIVQNFTTDKDQAAKAVRLPLGSLGASDSPYLSLISLLQGWPENKMRRSVIMVTDGIDRLRGLSTASGTASPSRMGPGPATAGNFGRGYQTMPSISPDVDRASSAAQRYGVIINSIYFPGVGRAARNYYDLNNGQNGMAKLADETGGESFYLGLQTPVSFKPYFDRLQLILDNQYFLVFQAIPGKKDGLQRVKISTEVPKVEIVSADNVWVPAAAQSAGTAK